MSPPPPPFPSALPPHVCIIVVVPRRRRLCSFHPSPLARSLQYCFASSVLTVARPSTRPFVRCLLSLASVVSSVGRSLCRSTPCLPPPTESYGSYTRTMNVDSCGDGGSLDRRRRNIDRRRPLVSWSNKSPFSVGHFSRSSAHTFYETRPAAANQAGA